MAYDISTLDVDEDQRFAYWKDVVCSHCIPAASDAVSSKTFNARLSGRSIGALSISQMSAPEHSWERDTRHLRTGPDEDFWLAYMDSGFGHLTQSGRTVAQQTGDIVLYDAARPFTFTLTPNSIFIAKIPRALLLHRVPYVDKVTATLLGDGLGVTRILGAMIREIALAPQLDEMPNAGSRIVSSILDLLSATLEMQTGLGVRRDSSHEALYQRALAFIEDHLEDPDFDIDMLAREQHISTRTLTRLFASHSTTVMRWTWHRRLEASHGALIEGSVRNVTEAALTYGFCDLSHFSRTYKRAYGVSPQNVIRKR